MASLIWVMFAMICRLLVAYISVSDSRAKLGTISAKPFRSRRCFILTGNACIAFVSDLPGTRIVTIVGLCKKWMADLPCLPVDNNEAYHSPGNGAEIGVSFFTGFILAMLCSFVVARIIISLIFYLS